MKEFDEFDSATAAQDTAVTDFSAAHSRINSTTSDLASKGIALKLAVDDVVRRAAFTADAAKATVSTPTQTGSATQAASLPAEPGPATEAIAPAPEPQIAAG